MQIQQSKPCFRLNHTNLFQNIHPISHPIHAKNSIERSLSQPKLSKTRSISQFHEKKNKPIKFIEKKIELKNPQQKNKENKDYFICDSSEKNKIKGSPFKKKLNKVHSVFFDNLSSTISDNSYSKTYIDKSYQQHIQSKETYIKNHKKLIKKSQKLFINSIKISEDNEESDIPLEIGISHRIPNNSEIFISKAHKRKFTNSPQKQKNGLEKTLKNMKDNKISIL